MIKKICVLFLLVLFFGKKINGQDSLLNKPQLLGKPLFVLSIKPTAFLHPRLPGLQLGGEISFNKYLGLNQEVGLVFIDNSERRNRTGFRSLTELRLYPIDFEMDDINLYLGLQYRYWKIKYDTDRMFCRAGCAYRQRLDYKVDQSAIGVNGSLGFYFMMGKRFMLDIGSAIGIISRKNIPDIPDDANLTAQEFFTFGRPDGEKFKETEPVLLFYLKIGYIFR